MTQGRVRGQESTRRSSRMASRAGSWATRVLQGSIVAAHLADTVDDASVLGVLPPTDGLAPGAGLPDALGLNMCSVDSTTTCPSTTWCQSTTACPSTTDCRSVQTCVGQDLLAPVGRAGAASQGARCWPVAAS